MIKIVCYCNACTKEISTPNTDQSIGYGIAGDVREAAPKETTIKTPIQICGPCVTLLVDTWKQRQTAPETPA